MLTASLLWQPGTLAEGLAQLSDQLAVSSSLRSVDSERSPATLEEALPGAYADGISELTALECAADRVARCIAESAPLIVALGSSERAVLVLRANARSVQVLAQDGRKVRVPMAQLIDELHSRAAEPLEEGLSDLERLAGSAAADACRAEYRRQRRTFVGWRIPREAVAFKDRLLGQGLFGSAAALLAVHGLHFGLWVLSWVLLVGALLSVGDRSALLTLWVLALGSSLLLLSAESLLQQSIAARFGVVIRQWLLKTALRLDEAALREKGIGALTAMALEADRLDTLATQGGLRVLLAALDTLAIVAAFLWFAGLQPLLLLFALALLLSLRWWMAYYKAQERLHRAQLKLTAVHTEEMIGHRARKALLGEADWHRQEESCLAAYDQACAAVDRLELALAAVPRLWAVLGVSVILLGFFGQGMATLTSVAMIGFVIVGFGILSSAGNGVLKLLQALVAFRFLELRDDVAPPVQDLQPAPVPEGSAQFIVQDLAYSYEDASRTVLRDVSFSMAPGEKTVLTGDSGSGKSTLGSLLAGRLQARSGNVLSQGMDRHVLGDRSWLQQVCYLPEPGSNHVLTDTFAFNLLLGRSWPPTPEDLAAAADVAGQLGLGPLMERMPGGMMQMIGEGGWRLSQGEQARLFLARGILQGSRVLIVD
ncbi:MAG: ATP-binding cassette domain-containing protein, partial [Pseudomonadota bacterium]